MSVAMAAHRGHALRPSKHYNQQPYVADYVRLEDFTFVSKAGATWEGYDKAETDLMLYPAQVGYRPLIKSCLH